MRKPTKSSPPPLDPATLDFVVQLLTERLDAVAAYGAGGCPTCHEGELRGAIARLRGYRAPHPDPDQ